MGKKGSKVTKTDAEKADLFRKLAKTRADRALRAIQGLSKLANTKKYTFTDKQVSILQDAFRDELTACFAAFEGKKLTTGGIEL